ncbi:MULTISPECIES: IclR family transcriptional regulator [Actinosynnema]|uniref:Transcriptional regulator, IclR family n=3 Tax=Actinosynnema TaxID=40566 RepID=C6WQM0_ACTMD|nr:MULTISPECIES: IclR family transcriptional regulator [Actinosynnema]ACU38710.1 transcriptional regulator, IclR family [Actinosynnema mirum DSM 43827]AXX32305.1 Transcriptional regulator, IclR family [Actinosynnema pretiosum subsp. pretiosum]MCP2096510.1 transcriptional regulator, IclR family [Actinosynnema pretiosum]
MAEATRPMQVVVRALDVLGALSAAGTSRSLQELHEQLDIPVGSMHRLLATLEQSGYVSRSPVNRRYFLGRSARALGQQARANGARLVRPPAPLEVAARESGETVFLSELIGDVPVCVALVEARHPLRLFVRIGQEMPLHAASSARSILAFQEDEVARALLANAPLTEYTSGTPRTTEGVLEHLSVVRAQGYDVCDNELDRNVWAVSAPVRSIDGSVGASVTLAAAGARMRDPLDRTRATATVLRAARALSEELGYVADED